MKERTWKLRFTVAIEPVPCRVPSISDVRLQDGKSTHKPLSEEAIGTVLIEVLKREVGQRLGLRVSAEPASASEIRIAGRDSPGGHLRLVLRVRADKVVALGVDLPERDVLLDVDVDLVDLRDDGGEVLRRLFAGRVKESLEGRERKDAGASQAVVVSARDCECGRIDQQQHRR